MRGYKYLCWAEQIEAQQSWAVFASVYLCGRYQVNELQLRLTGSLRWTGDSIFLPNLISCSSYAAVVLLSPLLPTREGRFQVLQNNNLQIRQVTKADEGVYRCEASVEARGEIDFVDIAVVVNGESII